MLTNFLSEIRNLIKPQLWSWCMLMTNIMSELRHLIKPWRWVGQSFQSVKRFQSFFGNSDTLMITCCLFGSKRRCCQSVWYDKHYLDQPLDRVVWIWTCLVLPSSKLLDSLLQEVCFLGKSVISSVLNADDSEIIDSKSTTLGPDVPHAAGLISEIGTWSNIDDELGNSFRACKRFRDP